MCMIKYIGIFLECWNEVITKLGMLFKVSIQFFYRLFELLDVN